MKETLNSEGEIVLDENDLVEIRKRGEEEMKKERENGLSVRYFGKNLPEQQKNSPWISRTFAEISKMNLEQLRDLRHKLEDDPTFTATFTAGVEGEENKEALLEKALSMIEQLLTQRFSDPVDNFR